MVFKDNLYNCVLKCCDIIVCSQWDQIILIYAPNLPLFQWIILRFSIERWSSQQWSIELIKPLATQSGSICFNTKIELENMHFNYFVIESFFFSQP